MVKADDCGCRHSFPTGSCIPTVIIQVCVCVCVCVCVQDVLSDSVCECKFDVLYCSNRATEGHLMYVFIVPQH